jgi:hypothetical protein
MPNKPKSGPRNPLEGKKVVFAESDRIEQQRDVANAVMLELFGFEPGEYLITDESSLDDFVSFAEDYEQALDSLWRTIESLWGINRKDVGTENLASLFETVARRKRIQ